MQPYIYIHFTPWASRLPSRFVCLSCFGRALYAESGVGVGNCPFPIFTRRLVALLLLHTCCTAVSPYSAVPTVPNPSTPSVQNNHVVLSKYNLNGRAKGTTRSFRRTLITHGGYKLNGRAKGPPAVSDELWLLSRRTTDNV